MNFLAATAGVKCGDVEIAGEIVSIIRIVFNAIKIGIPIILIVVGSVGMGKAIAAQKEDEIKKAQALLVKQAIAAVVIFLMFQLVQILMSVVNVKSTSSWACVTVIVNEPKADNSGVSSTACYKDTDTETASGIWKKMNINGEDIWKCE